MPETLPVVEWLYWHSGYGLEIGLLVYIAGWAIGQMVSAFREYMK